MTRHLSDVAYDIAVKEFKNKTFSFKDLWSKIVSISRMKKAEANDQIGEFYAEIMQDPRFIYCKNNNWKLKEFLSINDVKNTQNMLYSSGYSDDLYEEGYEQVQDIGENEELDNIQLEKTNEEIAAEFGYDDEIEEVYDNMNHQYQSKIDNDDGDADNN